MKYGNNKFKKNVSRNIFFFDSFSPEFLCFFIKSMQKVVEKIHERKLRDCCYSRRAF